MTGQSDSGQDQPLDPALADAVESAFDGVRDELGEDPQAGLEAGAAGSEEPDSSAASAAPDSASDSDGPEQDDSVQEPARELAEDGQACELERVRAEVARLTDELARARADQYNLQQEYQGFVRRSREGAAGHREAGRVAVVEALIPVLDEIELARQHGDLTGTFGTTAGKLETILADKFGLVRFGEAGEPFDPTLHEALMATESDEVDEPSIVLVLQPGYRLVEKVVRAARVQVANPA